MDAEVIKIFRPVGLSKYLQLLMVGIIFLMAYHFLNDHDISIFEDLFFVVLIAAVSLRTLLNITEKITITAQAVVVKNLISRKAIPLNSIQATWREYGVKGSTWLHIKTDQSKFSLGMGLSDEQLDEAVACILEQIQINFPKNFATVKHTEADKFWD